MVPDAAAGALLEAEPDVAAEVAAAEELGAEEELGAAAGGALLPLEPHALSAVAAAASEAMVMVARRVLIRWLLVGGVRSGTTAQRTVSMPCIEG